MGQEEERKEKLIKETEERVKKVNQRKPTAASGNLTAQTACFNFGNIKV